MKIFGVDFKIKWHHILRGIISLPIAVYGSRVFFALCVTFIFGILFNGCSVDGGTFNFIDDLGMTLLYMLGVSTLCLVVFLLFWIPEIKQILHKKFKRKQK